jgi:nicotinate dehydrogenase subunit B
LCAVCHTAHNGVPNAGGRALDTPFGTIYTTNITPDEQTGIGNWSFEAFVRAMRQGIHRDGRHLYPAFPYASFKNVSDDDLQALYAYLMSQTPVRSRPPETKLAFPFSVRPMIWSTAWVIAARVTRRAMLSALRKAVQRSSAVARRKAGKLPP